MDDDSDPDSGIPAERPHGWAVQYHNRTVYDAQKAFARRMRSAPTPAEDALWQAIRYKRMDGYKFRRQHAIERYIADFYCAEARLVIEVDGEIHLG